MTVAEPIPRASGVAAFRYKNFTLFWLSQVTTNVGSWMQIVATGWLVLQLTNSPAYLGYNAAFQAIPILSLSLIGGAVADRFDRYRLVVGSYIVQIFPDAALAWLVISGNIRVEHVFAYSMISASINGLATPARQAFVPSLVGKEALLSAMALNSIVWQGSAVIGPAVAGMILAVWGLPGSFNINVASDFVSLAAIAFVRVAPLLAARKSSGWNEIREGLAYAGSQPKVRVLLISVALTTVLARPYTQLMPAFARDVFAVGPQGLGWMLTLPAFGTVIGGILLAAIGRVSLVRVYIVTVAAMALGLIGFCATRSFPLALGLLFVIGGCSTTSVTVVNTMLQEITEERLRGRVMSLYMASTWGIWRLGALPIGLAAAAWGPPAAIGAAAVGLLLVLIPVARNPALHQVEAAPTKTRSYSAISA